MYFGNKTLTAVKNFQQKYKQEISNYAGYTISCTGYVGPATIKKLNQLLNTYRSGTGTGTTPPTGEQEEEEEEEEEEEPQTSCGNGIIETPNTEGIYEVCDTNQLNNQTCKTRGYAGGTLKCSNTCLTFDVSGCYKKISSGGGSSSTTITNPCRNNDNQCPSGCTHNNDNDCTYCGDNILQQPNDEGTLEVCDTSQLNGQTCQTKFGPEWTGSLSCSNDCLTFITTNCVPSAPENNPPVLGAIGNKSVNENQTLTFTIQATDIDNDTLTYSAENLPLNSSFNNQTFIFTPDYDQSGTYDITFTVSDEEDIDQETITLSVYDVNRAPILNSIGNKSVDENQTLTFTISAEDPDNDDLTYSVQNRPTNSSLTNQTFTFTPDYTQSGTYDLTFVVSDGELTDTETITLTVNNVETCTPATCDDLGYNCGTASDGCGGTLSCGSCDSGYTCVNNVCIEDTPTPACGDGSCNGTETCSTCPEDCGACSTPTTSCTQDSDCESRGPGFICNASNVCEWDPPIGIPKPSFGIEETYRMYDDPANRNPELTYHQNAEGGVNLSPKRRRRILYSLY